MVASAATEASPRGLWTALKNGQLQTLGSDQCSFNFNGQKDLGLVILAKFRMEGPALRIDSLSYIQKV